MPRDAVQDPDAAFVPPVPAGAPTAPSTSAIVLERARIGALSPAFVMGVAVLAGGALAIGLVLMTLGAETDAEALARTRLGGLAEFGLPAGRALSAIAVAVTVTSIAWAGRTLTRSDVGGLLAAALVALDPAVLAYGRLALPTALSLAGMALALACMLSPRPALAWVGAAALALAALVDPRALAWGPVLVLVLLLRGHIYASPRHLGLALVQGTVVPAVGAGLHLAIEGTWSATPACLEPSLWSVWTLRAIPMPGSSLVALPNPVTWFAGVGALLFLGLGGFLFAAFKFRLARANGRLQLRMVSPLPAVLGRGTWLLLLALATALAVPQALVLLLALALALGVQDLGADAPGFGLTLAVVLLLFAGVVLGGAWDGVAGTGGAQGVADAIRLVPWARASTC